MSSRSGRDRAIASRSVPVGRNPGLVVRVVVLIGIVVLVAALLSSSMAKEISRDEHMYCTAGVLLGQGRTIYRDFAYPSQLPYHPLLLATLYRGLGTTHYLLVARLVSVTCDVLVLILVFAIFRAALGRQRTTGLLFALAGAVLYVFNPFVDYAVGYAWNHDAVILCVVLSIWLFVTTDFEHRSRFWRVAIMGGLLTAATFMRVTTAPVGLLFLAAVLWTSGGSWRNRGLTTLPFLPAGLAVAVWPLLVIADASEAFRLNLLAIPSLYGRWLHEVGIVYDKVDLSVRAFLTPGYLVLLAGVLALAWIGWRHRFHLNKQQRDKAVLAALLPATFLLIAYIPPTMWPQYLAVPVPFLVIASAYPLVAWQRARENAHVGLRRSVLPYAVGAAAVISILAYPIVLSRSVFVLVPEEWTPVRLHRLAVEMADGIEEPKRVLTLGPLYALEGGCEIYPQLACGSIVYRVADQMSAEVRTVTRTIGPAGLDQLTRARPPSAVLVGVEPPYFSFLEEPVEQLVGESWRRRTYDAALWLYARP